MKKIRTKNSLITTLGVSMAICTILAGCAGIGEKQYEVANYQGKLAEGETKSDFNKELFYRNEKQTDFADPFVLDNTERDGYYYMYGTDGDGFCYRSENLMDWEPVAHALNIWAYEEDGTISEVRKVTWADLWAPEVIYDEETELYYLFFSATPQADPEVDADSEDGYAMYQLMVATSKFPDKDFEMVNFKDASSCGAENLHTYNEAQYPQYYTKYFMLDPEKYDAFAEVNGGRDEGMAGYTACIDPHPYVDDDGQKYFVWTDTVEENRICIVEMENWLKPNWETATVLTYMHYYTVEDWKNEKNGIPAEPVPFELERSNINEGAVMTKHNGKYYLTFSVNAYTDSSYQVAQAVSDNIMGPYRKLREEEGGILISGNTAGSQEISGTGHHSFVTVGDKMYIIYHCHDDYVTAGWQRHHAIDEVKWVKNADGLEVMYINGPTCTVQPAIEGFSDYRNIAEEAKVTGSADVSYLNDGLLSINKFGHPTFMESIKETLITETTTFTFEFDTARTVRAIMVYNSKLENTCFKNVSNIKFVCEEDGQEVIRYIDNMEFSPEHYKINDFDGEVFYIVPGAASYAEFDELNVKSIEVTVEVPEGQESVGISEIRILGK